MNFKELLSVKSQEFEIKSIGATVKLKQMTIGENKEYSNLLNTGGDYAYFALKTCLVEPEMITKEEYDNKDDLSLMANHAFQEIFQNIPLIGKNEKEIEEYKKMILDIAAENAKKKNKTKEEIEEEEEAAKKK